MRGKNQTKLPNKIYFIEYGSQVFGPYTSRPTGIAKKLLIPELAIIITYVKDNDGNYIKQL